MPSYTSLRNEGNGRNYQSNFHGTLEQVISDWKTDCTRHDIIWSILIEEPSGRVIDKFNLTNIIEEEKPVTKEFLNTELKPYNALTREEKHILLDAYLDGVAEVWQFDTKVFSIKNSASFYDSHIYRTKPKEYKKLDIPWQVIDEKWKYAAMEFNNNIWFFKSIPSYDRLDGSWDDKIHNGFTTADCLKLDTTGIVAEHSLTGRPE